MPGRAVRRLSACGLDSLHAPRSPLPAPVAAAITPTQFNGGIARAAGRSSHHMRHDHVARPSTRTEHVMSTESTGPASEPLRFDGAVPHVENPTLLCVEC